MIELTLKCFENYREALMLMNKILQWLCSIITTEESFIDVKIDGTLSVFDTDKRRCATLIMCEGESQKRINELLQNPPGEYKEKYIACVMSEEPEVVQEHDPDESMEDKDDDDTINSAAT